MQHSSDFRVIIVDAPPDFTELVRAALFDIPVGIADREGALLHGGPETLVVLYQAESLDDGRIAELARVGPTVVVAEQARSAEAVLSLDAGADGYLDAKIAERALRGALLGVARGELAYGRRPFGAWFRTRHTRLSMTRLTPRQRQIIDLIATGSPDKEIAAALGVRTSTVQKHVTRLLRRLGVRNRAAAVAVHGRSRRATATR